jgi:hypothetical protein
MEKYLLNQGSTFSPPNLSATRQFENDLLLPAGTGRFYRTTSPILPY